MSARVRTEPSPHGGRPPVFPRPVTSDGDLYRMTAAAAATAALGLAGDGALERATNAQLAELPHAEAMAAALWPGLSGYYLDALMQVGLARADRAWLRDWSAHYVRGGSVLPTLLIGAQPYGLLPVSRIEVPATPAGRLEHLEQVLYLLRPTWDEVVSRRCRDSIPRAATRRPAPASARRSSRRCSAAVPHPTAFSLQRVDDERADYTLRWDVSLHWIMMGAAVAPYSDGTTGKIGTFPMDWRDTSHDTEFDSVMWTSWLGLRSMILDAAGPDDQLAALEWYRGELQGLRDSPFYTSQQAFYDQWETLSCARA